MSKLLDSALSPFSWFTINNVLSTSFLNDALLPSFFMWAFLWPWSNLLPPLANCQAPSSFKCIPDIAAFRLPVTITPHHGPVDHFFTKQITKPDKDKSGHKICKCYDLFSLDTNSSAWHDLSFLFVSSLFRRLQVSRRCLFFSPFLFVSKNDQLMLISRFVPAP